MTHLPLTATDEEIIAFVDQWVSLLEAEDYKAACGFMSQDPRMQWTPESIREAIKSYGEGRPGQKVTLNQNKKSSFLNRTCL